MNAGECQTLPMNTFLKALSEQAWALWLPGAAWITPDLERSGEISFQYASVEGNYIRLLFPNLGGSSYSE